MSTIKSVKIEDATITRNRNFSGVETAWNTSGSRKFSVVLPETIAEELIDDGWNVSVRPPKEEGDSPTYYLEVKVKFGARPPVIKTVCGDVITELDEETVSILDRATIKTADLVIRPYDWEIGNKSGTAAYLKTGYFTIENDEFEKKYERLINERKEDDLI